MQKEYRILPVRQPLHGLKHEELLSDILGYELFSRNGIRLVSLGIFDSEDDAKAAAKRHAKADFPKFV